MLQSEAKLGEHVYSWDYPIEVQPLLVSAGLRQRVLAAVVLYAGVVCGTTTCGNRYPLENLTHDRNEALKMRATQVMQHAAKIIDHARKLEAEANPAPAIDAEVVQPLKVAA